MSQPKKMIVASPDASREVRDFYEHHPYPRPIDNLEKYRRLWQDRQRRRAEFHLHWPYRPYREDHSILIAGCGTSQAAKHAIRWPEAHVTGIDFSSTSAQCTRGLKRKYNLNNLRVQELSIERAGELDTNFDLIVCTGVLHHLPDPDAGLRALRSVLKPDGAMQLMVYAPYGRAGIYMLQEYCRLSGIQATDEGIRELISTLGALPTGHPMERIIREAADFREAATLADALLHPQDRAYSVPQLFDFIDQGGLTFGRWVRQAPYSSQCGLVSYLPQAVRMMELSVAEQSAAVELFRGTMVRHSAVVYRNDHPGRPHPISFAGDDWLDYVPIQVPDTICIQERLPAGAVAVLINRTHTYKDLFMPINSVEKPLFDAINGNCTIRDVVERTSSGLQKGTLVEAARKFFERLWRYDQVVFDASRQNAEH